MNKPLYGLLLGGFLGIFDGLSALVSAPETAPDILTIVVGSTFKGLLAGVLIGWFANKVHSVPLGVGFGLLVSGAFAFAIAAMPNKDGGHYWWEIMLPGCILGIIVGYATQRYMPRRQPTNAANAA
jgi:hypothetical protein